MAGAASTSAALAPRFGSTAASPRQDRWDVTDRCLIPLLPRDLTPAEQSGQYRLMIHSSDGTLTLRAVLHAFLER